MMKTTKMEDREKELSELKLSYNGKSLLAYQMTK